MHTHLYIYTYTYAHTYTYICICRTVKWCHRLSFNMTLAVRFNASGNVVYCTMLTFSRIQVFPKSLTLGVCMCILMGECDYHSRAETIFSSPASTALFAKTFCTVEPAKPVMSKIMLNFQACTC